MPSGRSKKRNEIYPSDSNRLVSALSPADREFFDSKATKTKLVLEQVLYEQGDRIDQCYFPTKGVVSMVTMMSNGAGAEVGLIGTEGMIGYSALLGHVQMPHEALVQGNGEAYKIAVGDLLKLRDNSKEAELLLLGYINSFLAFVSQSAACNALHKAETRLARWILLVQDRMHDDALPITHEFLANMLGIRRATVTVVANVLEEAGLISLGRREIRVLDREGLLKASCECYTAMTEATARALAS